MPQGSVLGPVLSIMYINDLYCYLIPNSCLLYADDTSLISTHKQRDKLTKEMASLFQQNTMKLNNNKIQRQNILSNPRDVVGDQIKLLRVTIDDGLRWSPHIVQLCRKLSCIILLLKRLKPMVNTDTLKVVIFLFSNFTCDMVYLSGATQSTLAEFSFTVVPFSKSKTF